MMPAADAQRTNLFPTPDRFSDFPVSELLRAAARGRIGFDQRLLHSILDQGDAAIPELVGYALEDREHDPVPLDLDLIAIFRHLRTAEALPYYVELLRETQEDCPDDLSEAIVALGAAAVEPLLKLYEELGEEGGSDTAFILASLGVRDSRILEVLLDQFEYSAWEGSFLLGIYGDPAAKPALERVLTEVPAAEKDLRLEIEHAIGSLRKEPFPSEPSDFNIWEMYPEKSPPAVDLLEVPDRLTLLESASADYRAEAATSFRRIELPDKIRDRLLEVAQADSDAGVRAKAWESLEEVDDPNVLRAMRAVVANTELSYTERGGALVALASQSSNLDVRKQILAFYEIPEARASAMRAMWRSLDRTFGQYFPKHLDDTDDEVRRQAIWGVGHLNLVTEAGRLQALFANEEYRADALYNYALCAPGGISRGRAKGLLRKIDELAEGLSEGETELVEAAIDQRLLLENREPVFHRGEEAEDEPEAEPSPAKKVGRNDPCPCGSGKKYKKCHGR